MTTRQDASADRSEYTPMPESSLRICQKGIHPGLVEHRVEEISLGRPGAARLRAYCVQCREDGA